MYKKVVNKIKKSFLKYNNLTNIKSLFGTDNDSILYSLGRQAREQLESFPVNERKKILYFPSYYVSDYHALSDATNILSLQVRGAEVIPVLSGYFFQKEDIIFGGVYNSDRFHSQYNYSQKENRLLTSLLMTEPISITPYLTRKDNLRADAFAQELSFDSINIEYNGIKIGKLAENAVVNMSMTPEFEHTSESLEQFRCHISNLIRYIDACEQLLKTINPDVIITNFPFYYKWSIPNEIAKKMKIPVYSFFDSERPNAFSWSSESKICSDSSPCWNSYYNSNLYNKYEKIIDKAVNDRKEGNITHRAYINPSGRSTSEINKIIERMDGRNSILFSSNVLIDAAVLFPSELFNTCFEMIKEVIQFFKENPNYCCILKAHPAEKTIPDTYPSGCRLIPALLNSGIALPENIILIDNNTKINSFDLYKIVNGLIAYTSSTSLEISFTGKKSLNALHSHYTCAGFCTVPKTKDDFFKKLTEMLSCPIDEKTSNEIIKLGKAYYFLNRFIVQTDLKLFSGDQESVTPSRLLYNNIDALLPGKNEALDYICDSILTGKPIFGENRWPPITI